MARASTVTALPLDRFSRIMLLNPAFFNGCNEIALASGAILFPIKNAQEKIWPQYGWQHSDQVSLEQMAMALYDAEAEIETILSYNVIPKWSVGELLKAPEYYKTWDYGNKAKVFPLAVDIGKSKFIAGGRESSTLVEQLEITWQDNDGDGWEETAQVSIDLTGSDYVDYSFRYFHFYFPDQDGDDEYEIRYPKKMWKSVNTLYAQFNTWELIDPDIMEALPTDDNRWSVNIATVPGDNLVEEIDFYVVENDTTQAHVEFYYTLNGVDTKISDGYIRSNDSSGFVTLIPATYTSGAWSNASCLTITPTKIKLWYQSGSDECKQRQALQDRLSRELALAISYLAVARLDEPYNGAGNADALLEDLRTDGADIKNSRRTMTTDMIKNPFGTRVGEIKAWQRVMKLLHRRAKYAII